MRLVFLDLDNTLIDADYHLNVSEDEFRAVIRNLERNDIYVGLCSDSAVITLNQWANRLRLTGPIVAERGAVIWNSMQKIENILNISETAWFRNLKESFVNVVMREFPVATIVIGDATRFVKEKCINAALTQQIFVVNGFRIASFSFFACRFDKDRFTLEPDGQLLKQASVLTSEIVRLYGKIKENLFWDENSQYGVLIIHERITEKWRGVSALINQFKPKQTMIIGDGMSDFLNLPCVIQYAVGNADTSYKTKATFVAKNSFARGVIECLKKFT